MGNLCTGNPLKPNHYDDCPALLSGAGSTKALIDANTTYIVFANGDKAVEFWKPATGWPSEHTVALEQLASPAALQQFYLPDNPDPKLSQHCNDVAADEADSKAANWWSANSWRYVSWTSGLCPAKYNIT